MWYHAKLYELNPLLRERGDNTAPGTAEGESFLGVAVVEAENIQLAEERFLEIATHNTTGRPYAHEITEITADGIHILPNTKGVALNVIEAYLA